jgi:predicted RNA binding protein YcfA (HicA-like mRNA interferase family)/predicted RNase H-like HicB family nuclease
VPPKIRELISDLQAGGFVDRGGKGSHRNFVHPKVPKPVTISGALGDAAKHLPSASGSAGNPGVKEMKDSARYVKIVEWSDEDHCYVGSSPGLIYGGCHGEDEKAVFDELCRIVEDAIELYRRDGRPLPPPTSGRDFANKMQDVA